MTEPTTPTGKQQHGLAWCDEPASLGAIGGQHGHSPADPEVCDDCAIVAAIEAEAAKQERERLRILVQQTIETLRAEDDGESRSIKVSIAAREHVLSLLAEPDHD